jgi:hypothetical protein
VYLSCTGTIRPLHRGDYLSFRDRGIFSWFGRVPSPFRCQRGVRELSSMQWATTDDSRTPPVCQQAHEVGEPGPAAACRKQQNFYSFHTIDELQTLICHSSVLPGTYGVTAMSWYTHMARTLVEIVPIRRPGTETFS